MAQALNVASRPGIFADAERILNTEAGKLREALARRRVYRRTLAELRALPMRQLEDIGYAGADLAAVARAAVARS